MESKFMILKLGYNHSEETKQSMKHEKVEKKTKK